MHINDGDWPGQPRRPASIGRLLVALCVTLAAVAALLYVTDAGMEWTIGLFVDLIILPLLFSFWSIFNRPGVPSVLAAAILIAGLLLAERFRHPWRFRRGAIALALASSTFWPMQSLAGAVEADFWEVNVILRGVALFVTVCLTFGGLDSMRRANNTATDDWWDRLR